MRAVRARRAREIAGFTLALSIAMLGIGAVPANADSIVYVKDANIWLAEPDGTNQTQVTEDGTAESPYSYPSQADDGTILAVKGNGESAQFHRLDQEGTLLVPPFDHASPGQPLGATVSPDGETLAYHNKLIDGGTTAERTYFSHADAFTEEDEITAPVNFEHPAWMSNSQVLLSFGAAQTYTYEIGDANPLTWFAETDVQVRDPDITIAPATDRIVVVDGEGAFLEFFETAAPPPAKPAHATCVLGSPEGEFESPSWKPDGTSLTWQEDDGIWTAGLPAISAAECSNFLTSTTLIVPGGSQPDWGPADVPEEGDTAPPETAINSGPEDGETITVDSASFGFTSGEANSTFECQLDEGPYQSCESPRQLTQLPNGAHSFHVRATDETGNTDESPASRTFTVHLGSGGDTTPPETTIDSGPEAGSTVITDTTTLGFSSNEGGSSFQCRVDNEAFAPCSSPKLVGPLGDGLHTFEARAIDAAGNIDHPEPPSRTFTVDVDEDGDTTPPETTIDSGPKNVVKTRHRKKKVIFGFDSSETGSTFECNFNDLGWQECWEATQVTVRKGRWHLDVRATDLAGNADAEPAEYDWVVKRKKRKKK